MSARRGGEEIEQIATKSSPGGRGGRWPSVVALTVMWIALWGRLSVANVLGGALVAAAVLLLARRVRPRPVRHFHGMPALRYLQTFSKQLAIANWQVARAVLRPGDIRPGIVAMPLRHVSDAVVTLVANSITLTPGTLTLDTERRGDTAVLYVHALDLSDVDSVREDIAELEKLAVDAFGGPQAQAVQARSLAELEQAADGSRTDTPDSDDDGGRPAS